MELKNSGPDYYVPADSFALESELLRLELDLNEYSRCLESLRLGSQAGDPDSKRLLDEQGGYITAAIDKATERVCFLIELKNEASS